MIYFDSAATTFQKPESVARAVQEAMATMSSPGRGGYSAASAAEETAFRCRSELAELFHVDNSESQGFKPLDFLGVVDDFAQAVEGGGVMQRGIVLIVGCMAIGWVAWDGAVFRLPTGVSVGKLAFGFGYGANHAETKAGMGIYRDNGHGFKWFRWMCRACGLRAAARKMPKESIRDGNRTRCV